MKKAFVVVTVGVAVALLVGGWPGATAGTVVAALLWRYVRRLPSSAHRLDRRRVRTDLPFAADLLAAALRAGAAPERAALVVGTAVGGPVGSRLVRIGNTMRLGDSPAAAWGNLGDLPGADRVVRAVVRSADSGAALAGALTRLADELRDVAVSDAEAAARRAGVLVVLPLGLCFLPAFLFAGVVPVVVAVLGGIL